MAMARIVQLLDGITTAQFEIDKPEFHIGRAPESDIYIDDASVSSDHCIIETIVSEKEEAPAEYYIRDLGSTNGTYVNIDRVERHRLTHEDVIRVGLKSFKFIDERSAKYVKTAKIKKSWIPGVYYTK
jgi:pSer/pThr/pTyr-binding forkhead associated (FHA) protein